MPNVEVDFAGDPCYQPRATSLRQGRRWQTASVGEAYRRSFRSGARLPSPHASHLERERSRRWEYPTGAGSHDAQGAAVGESKARAARSRLPLAFVPNAGQIDPRVRFAAQTGGASFFFTPQEAVLSFVKGKKGVLSLAFLGANPEARIEGQRRGTGKVNYLLGNEPSKWRTGLPTYEQVVYRKLWPGIDLMFTGTGGALKYEFRLAPGAKVSDIRLAYRGAGQARPRLAG